MPDIFVSSSNHRKKPDSSSSGKKSIFNLPRQFISSYLFMPDGVHFETQAPGEPIVLLLRRHWITNFLWVAVGILLIFMPLILFPVIVGLEIIPSYLMVKFFSLGILLWYLFSFSYILVNFLLWYFTVSIVTTERIIDIDFINILNKKFAETRIGRIEDVTNRKGGFIQSLFDFGDVIVQTAAKEAMFEFGTVPHPEQIVRIINELMGKAAEGRQHV